MTKKLTGFAAMLQQPGGRERVLEIATRGGKKVQALGTGHRWTKETARAARQKVLKTALSKAAPGWRWE